jgi:signal transduction histidine kinase
MHRSSGLAYAGGAATVPAPDAARALLTRGPPGGSGQEAAGAITADVIRHLADDHDRIARDLNDVAIHRIFAAGLDLEAALGLIGERPGTSLIHHAVDELDQAIRDIRGAVFGIRPRD